MPRKFSFGETEMRTLILAFVGGLAFAASAPSG